MINPQRLKEGCEASIQLLKVTYEINNLMLTAKFKNEPGYSEQVRNELKLAKAAAEGMKEALDQFIVGIDKCLKA